MAGGRRVGPASRRWDFFIAYPSAKRRQAQNLYRALSRVAPVFFDKECIQGGDHWPERLDAELRNSSIVVALLSAETAKAHYQVEEISRAIKLSRTEGKRIVPVLIEPVDDLPYGLNQIHALCFDRRSGWPRIVELLRSIRDEGAPREKRPVLRASSSVAEARADRTVPHSPPRDWLGRLNRHFVGHARVLGAPEEIRLKDLGTFPVPRPLISVVDKLHFDVEDGHGLLAKHSPWNNPTVELQYHRTDFRVVHALRQRGECPRVLSANAVLVAPKQRLLVLHKRSSMNTHYKNCLHTVGGAFFPPYSSPGKAGDKNLTRTMMREVSEETDQWPSGGGWPTLLADEPKTGFIEAIFLGVAATPPFGHETPEGETVTISFDSLGDDLVSARAWVPSGKLAVLAWLALGAPGAPRATFAGRSPTDLFSFVLERSARDYPNP